MSLKYANTLFCIVATACTLIISVSPGDSSKLHQEGISAARSMPTSEDPVHRVAYDFNMQGSTSSGLDGQNRSNNSVACTPRSFETFPQDLLTLEQKRHGAVVMHVLIAVWLFAALTNVCDKYFVASLEVICESLRLKPDVAGATFMAAGSSALELLVSVIGVFLAKSDVGVSTIIGSAIFNNLMITSLCGLATTKIIYLPLWPLLRDCGFYIISLSAFIAIVYDRLITWYESVVQLALFAVYIVVIVFSDRIGVAISKRCPLLCNRTPDGQHAEEDRAGADEDLAAVNRRPMGSNGCETPQPQESLLINTDNRVVYEIDEEDIGHSVTVTVAARGPKSPFTVPEGCLRRVYWLTTLPWDAAFYVTIPDCRRPGIWRRLFLLTFLSSVVWISGMVYVLVWMVCITGDTIGVPDTVMGFTLLAIGTCMPDAIAGVSVSKRGMSEMAIANSIGSNVFDITASLGLPWFISTALLHPGSAIVINSAGLTYTSIILVSTVILLLVVVCLNKMRIDRKMGIAFMVTYIVVISIVCLYESNVFGPLNPPACSRKFS